jgi:hypothetical protein
MASPNVFRESQFSDRPSAVDQIHTQSERDAKELHGAIENADFYVIGEQL